MLHLRTFHLEKSIQKTKQNKKRKLKNILHIFWPTSRTRFERDLRKDGYLSLGGQ